MVQFGANRVQQAEYRRSSRSGRSDEHAKTSSRYRAFADMQGPVKTMHAGPRSRELDIDTFDLSHPQQLVEALFATVATLCVS